MRVMITGVSSFTGAYIAQAFCAAGHEVLGTLTHSRKNYSSYPLKERRLLKSQIKNFLEEAPFGSVPFLEAINIFKPEIFINHGADIVGYRLPDFDVQRSVKQGLNNYEKVFSAFQKIQIRRVIHSGSVFEPHDQLLAKSVYGESKSQVALQLANEAQRLGLNFSKIFIPNPIGPLENEDRLIPFFVSQWKLNKIPHLSAPSPIADHIPAPWLARFYLEEALRKIDNPSYVLRRPSAFIMSNKELVDRFILESKEFRSENLKYTSQETNSIPEAARLGTEICPELNDPKSVQQFWKEWAASHWS